LVAVFFEGGNMKKIIALTFAILIAGCASYSGQGLEPGVSTGEDVMKVMGKPAMSWSNPDGSQVLAYPRGPAAFDTFMVLIDSKGIMRSKKNVLDMKHFAMIRAGMSKEEVLRILGPSQPQWTVYFKQRDELAWEWRYCDDSNYAVRFDVLFDNTSGKVRSTQSNPEYTKQGRVSCSH
jgi:hypothetical protein